MNPILWAFIFGKSYMGPFKVKSPYSGVHGSKIVKDATTHKTIDGYTDNSNVISDNDIIQD